MNKNIKSPLNRRQFLQRSALGLASVSLLPATEVFGETSNMPRNMVIYMSDEHNPKFSSAQGHPFIETPNMERMAAQGTLYENCYCPSPLCRPSRSAFMSGKWAHQNQCYNNCNVFDYDYPSYGAVLQEQGVHSAYFGKMDVYRKSDQLGFSTMQRAGDRGKPGDINQQRHPLQIRENARGRAKGYGPRKDPYKGDTTTVEKALDWLKTEASALEEAFVLVVNSSNPHFPHYTTQELWDRYPQGGDLPAYGRDAASANQPYARDLRDHFEADYFNEEDTRGLRRGYLGCVSYVDSLIGKFLDTLEETGLNENTVFAYTSDHGEMLGKFGMWWKCSLYEDSARVPLYVTGPGFEGSQRVKTPVSTMDLQASMFTVTQTKRPKDWVGAPLQSIALDDPDHIAFAEYHGHGTRGSGYMVRQDDWKLIHCAEAPHQLFNLAEDPEELTNLAQDKKDKRKTLQDALYSICDPDKEHQRAEAVVRKELAAIANQQAG